MADRVFISDNLAQDCVTMLEADGFAVTYAPKISAAELLDVIGEYDALLVRSRTKVNAELFERAGRLRVVGRAGVGVDNVDLEAATTNGVVVMNTPDGNTVSAAEQTVALILSLLRNIPQAAAAMREGRWDRTLFTGHEVQGKKVGIIGLGRIGRQVAQRLVGFEAELLGFDPFLSAAQAKTAGIALHELDVVVRECDILTVHTPLNEDTRGLLNEKRLATCKRGAFVVNVARGGIVDEKALIAALDAGHIAGAALDVFTAEPPPEDSPLRAHPKIICTPHLGASTEEAQERVAVDVARQVSTYLRSGTLVNAVNVIMVPPEVQARLKPYLLVAEALGCLHGQWQDLMPEHVEFEVRGDLSDADVRPLESAFFCGFFRARGQKKVNALNALNIAGHCGINVATLRAAQTAFFHTLINVRFSAGSTTRQIGGALFGKQAPQIVSIDDFRIAAAPRGLMLFVRNLDRKGEMGRITAAIGDAGVNIANAALGRNRQGGEALMALELDDEPSAQLLAALRAMPSVREVYLVRFPEHLAP